MSFSGGPTVHIIDGDSSFGRELVPLVESVGLRATHHTSGWGFLNKYEELSPLGCVALNVRLPGVSGLDILRRLRDSGSYAATIAMSDNPDVEVVIAAFKNGASEFLVKPVRDHEFLEAVQEGTGLYERRLNHHAERDAFLAKVTALTTRRKEVLSLMLAGKTNRQISKALGISEKTVESHRAGVFSELLPGSFAQLVQDATRSGLKEFLRR